MKVHTRPTRPFDVDGTLVVNPSKDDPPGSSYIEIYDLVDDRHIKMRVNRAMVRLLKEERSRGSHIIVWSRSGHAWASAVVLALALEDLVDDVYDKPMVYFDDLDAANWMKDRVFIGANERYKE